MLHNDALVSAVLQWACELHAIREQLVTANNNNAIFNRLAETERRIMEAIDKFELAVSGAFDKLGDAAESLGAAVVATGKAVDGIASDVAFLKGEIKKLQDSQSGPWTPQDQEILDSIQNRAETIATKVSGVSTTMVAVAAAAAALDAATETPPTLPAE